MDFEKTNLEGVILIKPKSFRDERGRFQELYNEKKYDKILIDMPRFVQDNFSESSMGVLRGLHFQKNNPQGKLVSVLYGEVFDVAADINPSSPTFGQYFSTILSDENNHQLYIPPGFAHGFCVLSEKAYFHYKCTDFYNPSDEGGVSWKCDLLNINWPIENPIMSSKDENYFGLKK